MNFNAADLVDSFQKQADTFLEFLSLIPWTEQWLIGVMAFHVFCLICVFMTRKYYNLQYLIFFILLILVYMTETINQYAAENWKLFAKENYFDSNGLFISTVFSTPVLLNCIIFIILWLGSASKTLIDIKKKQILKDGENENSDETIEEADKKTK